jgi:hypothetical protein
MTQVGVSGPADFAPPVGEIRHLQDPEFRFLLQCLQRHIQWLGAIRRQIRRLLP